MGTVAVEKEVALAENGTVPASVELRAPEPATTTVKPEAMAGASYSASVTAPQGKNDIMHGHE